MALPRRPIFWEGWFPAEETSMRSTPCEARIPANLTVSSSFQDGSFGRDVSSESVAEILIAH